MTNKLRIATIWGINRIINSSSYNATTNPIFNELGLLKLEDVINLELLKLMFQVTKDIAPKAICDLFKRNANIHNYQTRHRHDPIIIKRNYKPIDKSFISLGPKLWSNLNEEFKNSKTMKCLTTGLRKSSLGRYWFFLYHLFLFLLLLLIIVNSIKKGN